MIDWPEVEPQVTSRPPRLRHKQRAVERVGADMLEGDIDALFAGELAHDAFEPLGAVIDDVIGAERLGFLRLGVVADRGDDGAPIAFAILIAVVPMPEPPACTRMVSPGSSLALSNSMCCTVPKATGAQAASRKLTPGGIGTTSRAGMLIRSRAKPSTWKPMMRGDVFAKIVAALAAGLAGAAGQRAIGDDAVADFA